MKIKNLRFGIFLFSATLLSCQSSNDKAAGPVADKSAAVGLAASMQNLKSALTQLLPIVVDPAQFNAEKNQEKIQKDVQDLVTLSKQVVHSPMTEHMDPSMRFISTAFSQDLERAQESLSLNKKEFARYTLLNVTAYCIECHTRTNSGPAFSSPEFEKALAGMNPMARGEFLLSTRQFAKALQEFESMIKSLLGSGTRLFELDKALRYSLSISVKFLQDPQKSLEIVNLVENASKAPYYLKQDAHMWAGAIREWQSEKKTKTPPDILRQADNLLKSGKAAQLGSSNRGGEIYFLRSISLLNAYLVKNLDQDSLGHALFLTGVAYEAVGDVSIWSLHEDYFESCIRSVPHSKWAEKCYGKLEESAYLGFTGTAGVELPVDVEMRLQDFRKLAFPL
jgi:hypothetical protein